NCASPEEDVTNPSPCTMRSSSVCTKRSAENGSLRTGVTLPLASTLTSSPSVGPPVPHGGGVGVALAPPKAKVEGVSRSATATAPFMSAVSGVLAPSSSSLFDDLQDAAARSTESTTKALSERDISTFYHRGALPRESSTTHG